MLIIAQSFNQDSKSFQKPYQLNLSPEEKPQNILVQLYQNQPFTVYKSFLKQNFQRSNHDIREEKVPNENQQRPMSSYYIPGKLSQHSSSHQDLRNENFSSSTIIKNNNYSTFLKLDSTQHDSVYNDKKKVLESHSEYNTPQIQFIDLKNINQVSMPLKQSLGVQLSESNLIKNSQKLAKFKYFDSLQKYFLKNDSQLLSKAIDEEFFDAFSKQQEHQQKSNDSGQKYSRFDFTQTQRSNAFSENENEKLIFMLTNLILDMDQNFSDSLTKDSYIPSQKFIKQFFQELCSNMAIMINELIKCQKNILALSINMCLQMVVQMFDTYVERHMKVADEHAKEKIDQNLIEMHYLQQTVKLKEKQLQELKTDYKQRDLIAKEEMLQKEQFRREIMRENDELRVQIKQLTSVQTADYCSRNLYNNSKVITMEIDQLSQHLEKKEKSTNDGLIYLMKMTKDQLATSKRLRGKEGETNQGTDVSEEITYATTFNNIYQKCTLLFEHPFKFFYQPRALFCLNKKLLENFKRIHVVDVLEGVMEQISIDVPLGNSLTNAPNSFLEKIIEENSNLMGTSIKITEIINFLRFNQSKVYSRYYCYIFGILQKNYLREEHFTKILHIHRKLKLVGKGKFNTSDYINDTIYADNQSILKVVGDVLASVFNKNKNNKYIFTFNQTKELGI